MKAADASAELARRLEELLAQLLPQGERWGHDYVALNPTRDDRNLGSFRICLTGDKRGRWRDFATDDGGDALDLVAYLGQIDPRHALRWAAEWLGHPAAATTLREGSPTEAAKAVVDTEGRASKIWGEALPIQGSPADAYLQGRGIDILALPRLPSSLRFHPRVWHRETRREHPCMVAWILRVDRRGAIHRTWLERRGGGWGKLSVADPKQSLGPVQGGFVPVARGRQDRKWPDARIDDTIAVLDGLEDALTIALARPDWRVACAVAVGNFAFVDLPAGNVVLFRDREDKPDAQKAATRAYDKAVARFRAQGRTVWFWDPPAGGGKDPNDLLTGQRPVDGGR